jgi:hypothetical protein
VLGGAPEQRPRQLDPSERVEGRRGQPPTPTRWVDPVGDLSLPVHREAPDRSHEDAVGVDREQRAVRVVADLSVVSIERFTVGGVGSRERRHRDSTGISLPLEELVEIGVVDDPQADAHAAQRRDRHRQARAPSETINDRRR